MKDRDFLIFMDVDGTLLKDGSSQIDEADMEKFLNNVNELEEKLKCKVKIHLISPMESTLMEKIMMQADKMIDKYNIKKSTRIYRLEGAGVYPNEYFNIIGSKKRSIIPIPPNYSGKQDGHYGKRIYVETTTEHYKQSPYANELVGMIYAGNGSNDREAMEYIYKKGGHCIGPSNSSESLKDILEYRGECENLAGIAGAMEKVVKDYEKKQEDPCL